MTCPKCSAQIQTQVEYQVSTATWLMCLVIFGIGCLGTLLFAIGFMLVYNPYIFWRFSGQNVNPMAFSLILQEYQADAPVYKQPIHIRFGKNV